MEPSQLGLLEGVEWDKGHREFTQVRPLMIEVKAYVLLRVYCRMINYKGADSLDRAVD